jgi:hypothetical protein
MAEFILGQSGRRDRKGLTQKGQTRRLAPPGPLGYRNVRKPVGGGGRLHPSPTTTAPPHPRRLPAVRHRRLGHWSGLTAEWKPAGGVNAAAATYPQSASLGGRWPTPGNKTLHGVLIIWNGVLVQGPTPAPWSAPSCSSGPGPTSASSGPAAPRKQAPPLPQRLLHCAVCSPPLLLSGQFATAITGRPLPGLVLPRHPAPPAVAAAKEPTSPHLDRRHGRASYMSEANSTTHGLPS